MKTAKHPTICPRCELVIQPGTPYVLRKGEAIHPYCAPGSDDS